MVSCGPDLRLLYDVLADRLRSKPKEWRCFHCDEVFTDPKAAALQAAQAQREEEANG